MYSDVYNSPAEEKRRELFHCPIQPMMKVEGMLGSCLGGVSCHINTGMH